MSHKKNHTISHGVQLKFHNKLPNMNSLIMSDIPYHVRYTTFSNITSLTRWGNSRISTVSKSVDCYITTQNTIALITYPNLSNLS